MPNFDYNFNKMAYINFFNSKEQRTLVKLVEKEGFLKVYNSVGKTTFNRNFSQVVLAEIKKIIKPAKKI